MTTIAWDGKTLAADRGAWSGTFCYRARKVWKIANKKGQPMLVAVCGDAGFAAAYIEFLRGRGAEPTKYPDDPNKTYGIALLVDHHKRTWRVNSDGRRHRVYGKLVVMGGGQEGVMCAMLAGAGAREAVLIVAKCTELSRFGADAVRF